MSRLFVCCVSLLLMSSVVQPYPVVQEYPTTPTPQSNQPMVLHYPVPQVNVPQGRPVLPTDRIVSNGRNSFSFDGPQQPIYPQFIVVPNPEPDQYYRQFYVNPVVNNPPFYQPHINNPPFYQPFYNQQPYYNQQPIYNQQPYYNQEPIYNMPY